MLELKRGLNKINSPYLSTKKSIISFSFLPSFNLSFINTLKSLAKRESESSMLWLWHTTQRIFLLISLAFLSKFSSANIF